MKCCDITANDLRTLVIIEEEANDDDGYGGQKVTWTPVANTFAKVMNKKGHEDFKSDARRSVGKVVMVTRFNPDITPKMRVSWKDKTGNIVHVDNVEERDVWLELTVEENIGE